MTATGTKPKNPCRRGKVHTCRPDFRAFQCQGKRSSIALAGWVVDAGEHVGEPGAGIDVVEPCGLDQGVQAAARSAPRSDATS